MTDSDFDLNAWELVIGSAVTGFGSQDMSDYPFKTQVSVGSPDATYGDSKYPSSDGSVMGRDLLGGMTLSFECQITNELSDDPVQPWDNALDLYNLFAAQWRGDGIRLNPGEVCSLRNLNRERQVFGRPRRIAPKHTQLRKGFLDFQMDFDTSDPNFYSLAADTIDQVHDTDYVAHVNAGSLAAWPVITFAGANQPTLSLSSDLFDWGFVAEAAGSTVIIDTRPWNRGVSKAGAPAPGIISGYPLDGLKIPAGDFEFQYFDAGGTTGTTAHIEWYRAYPAL